MFSKEREQFLKLVSDLREFAGFLDSGAPVCLYNEENKLHSDKSPAYRSQTRIIWFRDGMKHGMDADRYGTVNYYYRNVLVPDHYFLKPAELDFDHIITHENAEVRVVGLEIYGYDRMEREKLLKVVHRDPAREMTLYSYRSKHLHEQLKILKVKNSTPEPDGHHKNYYLLVPPNMSKCLEAVAWTFNMTAEEYAPEIET